MNLRWLAALALALATLGGCTAKTAPSPSAAAAPGVHRYHDGRQWVTVRVLLDRLQVERGTSERITAREVYVLRKPVSSTAELEEVARQMRAAQPDIRVLSAFIEEAMPTGPRRGRLTRQVVVRVAAGVDPAEIIAGRGARIVWQVGGRTDTVVIEAFSPDLLAAFALAEALRSATGVVVAIPLSE
jgi:hypothetical protein